MRCVIVVAFALFSWSVQAASDHDDLFAALRPPESHLRIYGNVDVNKFVNDDDKQHLNGPDQIRRSFGEIVAGLTKLSRNEKLLCYFSLLALSDRLEPAHMMPCLLALSRYLTVASRESIPAWIRFYRWLLSESSAVRNRWHDVIGVLLVQAEHFVLISEWDRMYAIYDIICQFIDDVVPSDHDDFDASNAQHGSILNVVRHVINLAGDCNHAYAARDDFKTVLDVLDKLKSLQPNVFQLPVARSNMASGQIHVRFDIPKLEKEITEYYRCSKEHFRAAYGKMLQRSRDVFSVSEREYHGFGCDIEF